MCEFVNKFLNFGALEKGCEKIIDFNVDQPFFSNDRFLVIDSRNLKNRFLKNRFFQSNIIFNNILWVERM